MNLLQMLPSDGQAKSFFDFLTDRQEVTIVLIVLIIVMGFVIWKIAPSYFDKVRLQEEIDDLEKRLKEEKEKIVVLTKKIDEIQEHHIKEIKQLNQQLINLSKDVILIKAEHERTRT